MTDNTRLRNPLEWDGGYWNRTPIWPREPDIDIIKTLVKDHLRSKLPDTLDSVEPEVTFFAGGAFNKLYLITYSGHETSYLFRATLPVIPFFKTESEVATLAFLRAKFSIPVAEVIAWNSDSQNDLGFEWILMEKLGGVELGTIWRKIPWDRKLEVVDDIARIVSQLRNHTFDSIGSLYFKSALATEPDRHETQSESQERTSATALTKAQGQEEFVIGPIFSSIFYFGSRLYLPGHRGAYRRCSEWLQAAIEMQLTWVKAGRVEGDPGYGRRFEQQSPEMIKECYSYLETLPGLFSEKEDQVVSVLHHGDLNLANILINPETFEITGIVDWEMVNILPTWRATDYPELLKACDPEDDEEPPIPDYDGEDDLAIDTRDQWDNRILRIRFDETMARLSAVPDTSSILKSTENKREFESAIIELCDNIRYAQSWLVEYKARIAEVGLEQEHKDEDQVKYDNGDGLENEISSEDSQGSKSPWSENTGDDTGTDVSIDLAVAEATEKTALGQFKNQNQIRFDNIDGLIHETIEETELEHNGKEEEQSGNSIFDGLNNQATPKDQTTTSVWSKEIKEEDWNIEPAVAKSVEAQISAETAN